MKPRHRTIRGINTNVIKVIVFTFIGLCLALTPAAAGANTKAVAIYVANCLGNTMSRANIDGMGGVSFGDLDGNLDGPTYIALDASAGKMYLTNWWNEGGVVRANLDGTGGERFGDLGGALDNSLGIALDVTAGKMYVVSHTTSTVVRANLDGTGVETLGTLGGCLNRPGGIALDIPAGKMYVVNERDNNVNEERDNKVIRANLDGTGGQDLGNLNGTLNDPWGIALDVAAGKMYVTNHGSNTVIRANLDGTGGQDLGNLNGTLDAPAGIALDIAAGKMYVANWNSGTVSRANLDGSDGESLGNFNGTLDGPEGIALVFLDVIYVSSDGLCSGKQLCFTRMNNAIESATAASIIAVTQESYSEDINLNADETITLQGGWNAAFTSISSFTTVDGSITIAKGTLILENIIVQ